ncbi:peroxiredoxin-like family protein [Nocardia mexicana]|uniref:thioredoxin-dependent peroxiredoxin n=1 Tax=Nocardia mexicana TaxID=279262 RepID=A0A370H234_9NOCA|nr:peroxiredoxin-like family protein [Nocardia mexicana]RDI50023.1 peroxiredoxin [Nocardia mexicana]
MAESYADNLIRFQKQYEGVLPEELVQRAQAHAESLSDLGTGALAIGDLAPDFTLTDHRGERFALTDALRDGPVVLSFYRGGWCPYCNVQLHTLQTALPQLRTHGARLVAVSPDSPDDSLTTAERNGLEFEVLSDPGNHVARAYGLLFTVPADVRDIYRTAGADLDAANPELPIPATYVVGTDGRILYAHVDGDYRNRAEADDILKALADQGIVGDSA